MEAVSRCGQSWIVSNCSQEDPLVWPLMENCRRSYRGVKVQLSRCDRLEYQHESSLKAIYQGRVGDRLNYCLAVVEQVGVYLYPLVSVRTPYTDKGMCRFVLTYQGRLPPLRTLDFDCKIVKTVEAGASTPTGSCSKVSLKIQLLLPAALPKWCIRRSGSRSPVLRCE
jgi:hypothetical protein